MNRGKRRWHHHRIPAAKTDRRRNDSALRQAPLRAIQPGQTGSGERSKRQLDKCSTGRGSVPAQLFCVRACRVILISCMAPRTGHNVRLRVFSSQSVKSCLRCLWCVFRGQRTDHTPPGPTRVAFSTLCQIRNTRWEGPRALCTLTSIELRLARLELGVSTHYQVRRGMR